VNTQIELSPAVTPSGPYVTAVQTGKLPALNVLAVVKARIGSLPGIARVVRLGVYIATAGNPIDPVKVADGASELLRDVLGEDKIPGRLVIGVARLPFDTPVELEAIIEVSE
jgi:enamine deaminase RidA (YjgF/YER057c/UK114 family)